MLQNNSKLDGIAVQIGQGSGQNMQIANQNYGNYRTEQQFYQNNIVKSGQNVYNTPNYVGYNVTATHHPNHFANYTRDHSS